MNVRTRIRAITLINKINEHKAFSDSIGVTYKMKSINNQPFSNVLRYDNKLSNKERR